MSMISGLIDELNKSADEWNSSNMFELARMCRDAADTIWQLRDDLQRANAENAKLREQCADMDERHAKTFEVGKRWMAKAARFESENTKLRELVQDYHRFADAMCAERDCDGCSQRDEGACERGVLTSRECVLGVEVE